MSHVRTLVVAVWVSLMIAVPAGARPSVPAQGEPGDIAPTGATDVTADLQALFDRTPDGGVVQLQPRGNFRVEGTLVLDDRHDLRIEGNGARIFATTTADLKRSHLKFIGGSDLVVRDLEIEGANPHAGLDDRAYVPELEGQYGIHLDGVTAIELDAVNVHDTSGDLVYVSRHEGDRRWSQQVWIHDSTFARSGRQGIAVVAARGVGTESTRSTEIAQAPL